MRAGARPRSRAFVGPGPWLPWLLAGAIYLGLALWMPANPFLVHTSTSRGVTTFVLDRGYLIAGHVGFALIAALLGRARGIRRTWPRSSAPHSRQPIYRRRGLISCGIFLWHYVVTLQLDQAGRPFLLVLVVTLATSIRKSLRQPSPAGATLASPQVPPPQRHPRVSGDRANPSPTN